MENHQTWVTVTQTEIVAYDSETNETKKYVVVGKLNISECKEYLKNMNLGILVMKNTIKQGFNVDTIRLLSLKQD